MSNGLVLTVGEALSEAAVAELDVTALNSAWTEWFPTPHDHTLTNLAFGSTTCWYTVVANVLFWEVFIDNITIVNPASWIGVPLPVNPTVNNAFRSMVHCFTDGAFGFGVLTAKSSGYLEFFKSDLSQVGAGSAHILGGSGFYPIG